MIDYNSTDISVSRKTLLNLLIIPANNVNRAITSLGSCHKINIIQHHEHTLTPLALDDGESTHDGQEMLLLAEIIFRPVEHGLVDVESSCRGKRSLD